MATKTYRCKRSFVLGANGANRVIRVGDIIAAGDPRFKQYKHLLGDPKFFETSDAFIERTIEQATAAPGEKRAVGRPAAPRKAAKTPPKSKAASTEDAPGAETEDGKPTGPEAKTGDTEAPPEDTTDTKETGQ